MPAVPEALYTSDGERFVPTELTRGPWDPDSQHAGPPSALIAREIERMDIDGGGDGRDRPPPFVARLAYEILRPVPIAPLTVSTRIARPGRSVELVEATLADERGEVMLARAWRIHSPGVELPAGLASEDPGSPARPHGRPGGPGVPAPLAEAEARPFVATGQRVGYHTAMEYLFTAGGFREPGPATVWMRMRCPLLEGEQPSPLQRVLAAADSGNGISATLEWGSFLFINVDLTVHLHRMPVGEWVCLDAVTIPEPTGVGLSDTALFDERGPIGRAAQTLFVAERR